MDTLSYEEAMIVVESLRVIAFALSIFILLGASAFSYHVFSNRHQ